MHVFGKRSVNEDFPLNNPNLIAAPFKKIVMGTDEDPFNKPELVHTLKGKELCLFVIFYAFAVCLIVLI
ncbi:unnamed protein product [Auanema sp. JU1783]|nr:unnamed protein product [Auanema sp. JU1783]